MPVELTLQHMQHESLQSMPDNFCKYGYRSCMIAELNLGLLLVSTSTQAAKTTTREMQGLIIVLHIHMAEL